MADAQPVKPVKLIVAVLFGQQVSLEPVLELLQTEWGPIDYQGTDRPFDLTDYYEPEMGTQLQRRLVAFYKLVPPESIRAAKIRSNELERSISRGYGLSDMRVVNLDIGYLDHAKLVLASVKFAGQKIHLGDGIYADLIARFRDGRYQPFDWTFPDFKDGRYDEELVSIRSIYLRQLR